MTQKVEALQLGGGQVRVAGRHVGQVKGCYVERQVNKATHDTNWGLETTVDHVLAIRTAFMIGWTFEEVTPENTNLLCGSPGFSAVPSDRSLSIARKDPALLSGGTTRAIYREHPKLIRNKADGRGIFSPLLYPLRSPTSSPADPAQIAADNIDFNGTFLVANTYKAYFVTTGKTVASGTPGVSAVILGSETLPSNIEYQPESVAGDDMVITIRPVDLVGFYTIWVGVAVRQDNGEFTFAATFQQVATHNGLAIPALVNGQFQVTVQSNAAMFAANAPNPFIHVRRYTDVGVGADYVWPVDYQYNTKTLGGGAIKLTPNTTIPVGGVCQVEYYYDISRIRELPLAPLGRNPVVECDLEILFPDNESKMIWHFFRLQINTNFRIAASESDWNGVDFSGETLDASNVYRAFGYGYLQFVGPMADEILNNNNVPFGVATSQGGQALGNNQTRYS